jgi:hypothetical protein
MPQTRTIEKQAVVFVEGKKRREKRRDDTSKGGWSSMSDDSALERRRRRRSRRSTSAPRLPRNLPFLVAVFLVWFSGEKEGSRPWMRGADGFAPQQFPTNTATAFQRIGILRQKTTTTAITRPETTVLRLSAEAIEPLVLMARTATDGYGTLLVERPLSTKSLTAGILCGISDVIAQTKSVDGQSYDAKRTLRFASKGCLGGLVWMVWYEWIDGFLAFADEGTAVSGATDADSVAAGASPTKVSLYALAATVLPPEIFGSFGSFCRAHLGAVSTATSMVLEQFVWCPLVFGTFEIPVATLLNGGSLGSVPAEIRAKLRGLLVSNATVWTPANLIIYSAPLEWRLFLGNCVDVLWQTIVSDVAADCGNENETNELCELPDEPSPTPVVVAAAGRQREQ